MFVVRRCGARLGFRLIEYRAMRTPANQAFIYKDGALIGPTLYFVRRRRLLAAKRLGTKLTSPRLNKGVARIAKRHRDAKGEGAGKGAFKGRLSPSLRGILNFLAGYFERKIDIVFVLSLDRSSAEENSRDSIVNRGELYFKHVFNRLERYREKAFQK